MFAGLVRMAAGRAFLCWRVRQAHVALRSALRSCSRHIQHSVPSGDAFADTALQQHTPLVGFGEARTIAGLGMVALVYLVVRILYVLRSWRQTASSRGLWKDIRLVDEASLGSPLGDSGQCQNERQPRTKPCRWRRVSKKRLPHVNVSGMWGRRTPKVCGGTVRHTHTHTHTPQ